MQAFVDRFGPYAGWAHNALFISELASHKHLLSTLPGKRLGELPQRSVKSDKRRRERSESRSPSQLDARRADAITDKAVNFSSEEEATTTMVSPSDCQALGDTQQM
jgi:hypothetical protein